ncbi:MAG: 23S rRNA (adenine(2503)-C(2))-methyltransferase RlmN [Planctomycetota bacterium JB042]
MAAPPGERPCLTDLPVDGYDVLLGLEGARRFHPANVRRWVLARGVRDVDAMTDLPKTFRAALADEWDVRRTRLALASDSDDGTTKLLLELRDGQTIESVLIPEGDRLTLCVSTQVGCGVRCAFCASGLLGVVRDLTSGEIVEQFLEARALAAGRGRSLTNLVLMGGGEPLNNFTHVRTALEALIHADGAAFGARRITVSTIGIPKKIDRLEELGKQVNLAISLHAPNEALRGRLIPGLDRVPLDDVLAAAGRYFRRTGREITFEYAVLKGVNDSVECAEELARRLKGVRGKVNLIPWNPVADLPFDRPDDAAVDAMVRTLEARGVRTTVRRSRGRDIDAACGQLRRRFPTGDAVRERGAGP